MRIEDPDESFSEFLHDVGRCEDDCPYCIGRESHVQHTTGKVVKRRDLCANNKRRGSERNCLNWARNGSCYCSTKCRTEALKRNKKLFVGGSIDRHIAEFERDNPHHRDQVGGTRFPRENSTKRDGYE